VTPPGAETSVPGTGTPAVSARLTHRDGTGARGLLWTVLDQQFWVEFDHVLTTSDGVPAGPTNFAGARLKRRSVWSTYRRMAAAG